MQEKNKHREHRDTPRKAIFEIDDPTIIDYATRPYDAITRQIIGAAIGVHKIHEAQVLTYLKLTGCNIGLLINFNVWRLKQGIRRIIV